MSSLLAREQVDIRLSAKPSNVLRKAREKYIKQNPMSMEEIDDEIESFRSLKQDGGFSVKF